jgi:membrane associated rhomboid family serine protease
VLIPYRTNAPVYHWPIATVALIGCNLAAYLAAMLGRIDVEGDWFLSYGDGLHPRQWLLSMFMHGSLMHLAGNMLFLWLFGLIIEGKLGWWKFLLCYLGIGMTESMIEQAIMFEGATLSDGSLGASAAIFGLIGMAAVWAPMSDIECLWTFSWYYHADDLDVPVYGLALLYAGLEMLSILFGGHSGWLHLGGMAIGVPLAVGLLKLGVVDCEQWDIFNVIRGTDPSNRIEPSAQEVFAKVEAKKLCRDERQLDAAQEQLSVYLQQNNPGAALRLYEKMTDVGGGLKLDRGQLLAVIKWLHGEKRWADSASFMADLIARFPEQSDAARIKLAQICVVELGRPGKALELLAAVEMAKLSDDSKSLLKRIAARAKQMQAEGVVELDVDTW